MDGLKALIHSVHQLQKTCLVRAKTDVKELAVEVQTISINALIQRDLHKTLQHDADLLRNVNEAQFAHNSRIISMMNTVLMCAMRTLLTVRKLLVDFFHIQKLLL